MRYSLFDAVSGRGMRPGQP